jgi:Skp family chaperone for outer membrane proteins
MTPRLLPALRSGASAVALTALALALTGCEPLDKLLGRPAGGAPSQVVAVSTFAVLDLNEVATRIGRSAELQNALSAREQSLVQQLVQLQSNLQQKVDAKRTEFGEKPTAEQEQELAKLASGLNAEFLRARASAQQALGNEQSAMIQQFRAEVLPVAAEIAAERGLTTILTKNEAVLFAWDPASDITEEVIKRMATPLVP